MMTKEELIGFLYQCLKEEETAVPLYSKHLTSTLFLSDFKPEDQNRVKELLVLLREKSELHARFYQKFIKSVEESMKNVY